MRVTTYINLEHLMPNENKPISPQNRRTKLKSWAEVIVLTAFCFPMFTMPLFRILGAEHLVAPFLGPLILYQFFIVPIGTAAFWIMSPFIFGNNTFKLETKEGKLNLEVIHYKGLLDTVGYHNPYSRVSVDNVIDNLSDKILGLEEEFNKLEKLQTAEIHLKGECKQLQWKLYHLKQVKGSDCKQETQSLIKHEENVDKAHAQIEETKNKLEALISDRTLAALKSKEKMFTADEQQMINKEYIQQSVKKKFALN